MWRAVFLHEFPDRDLRHFTAVAGTLTATPSLVPPRPEPPVHVLTLRAPESLRFQLAAPWGGVVGFSGRVRVRLSGPTGQPPFPVMQVGQALQLRLQVTGTPRDPSSPDPSSPTKVLLQVGTAEVELATTRLPRERFADIRFDWHSSGQARLEVDGRLIGYHNALAPGAELSVPDVVVGNAPPVRRSRLPVYDVARVFVRALRRDDPVRTVGGLVGDVTLPDVDEAQWKRCVGERSHDILALTRQLRAFMAQVHAQLSQPWQEDDGPTPGPFTQAAVRAHRLALEAGAQLVRMLATRDFSRPEAFLTPYTGLLQTLHDARPDQFRQLVVDHLAAAPANDPCAEVGGEIFAVNRLRLEPVYDLLERASAQLHAIAGVA
jgi:hypothetical protein